MDKNMKRKYVFKNEDLSKYLGNVAILEGDSRIDELGNLPDILSAIKNKNSGNVYLTLLQIYHNPQLLSNLPANNIETIMFESSMVYQDKIYGLMEWLINCYNKTGYLPKRVINTLDYGLDILYYVCSKLGIDVFTIEDNLEENAIGEFILVKILYDEKDREMIEMKMSSFSELFDGNK